MRVAACFAAMLVLTACGKERSFDERYESTSGTIENQARAIDRELENHSEGAERERPAGARTNGSSQD